MATLASWIRAARPLAQANLAIPLALGQAAAYHAHGTFDLRLAIAIHAFGLFDHLLIVFANDYADRETDDGRTTWISGGSGVLASGAIRPEALRRAAFVAGALAFAVTVPIVAVRPWVLFAAPVAAALLAAYSLPPFDLSRRGGGEWLQSLGVGVGLPAFGFYVQSGDPRPPAAVLLPSFLLAFAGHVLTALPDETSDRAAHKRTLVVRLGAPRATALAMAAVTVAAPFVAVATGPTMGAWKTRALLVLAVTVPTFGHLLASIRRGRRPFSAVFAALVSVELVLVTFVLWLAGCPWP